jgi:hypothetical protein
MTFKYNSVSSKNKLNTVSFSGEKLGRRENISITSAIFYKKNITARKFACKDKSILLQQ